MRAKSRFIAFAAVAVLAVAVVSCGDDPNPVRPSSPGATPPTVTPAVTRVDTVIPASMEPGASVQATARATMSDGSSRDVTSEAQWSSSNTGVVRAGSTGVLAAGTRGEAVVVARHSGRSSSGHILVLPTGTFRLTGRVADTGVPVDGVRVEVIGGTGQGLSAVSNAAGDFALYGVGGRVTLHSKKQGYVNRTQDVDVTSNQSVNVDMQFDGPRAQLEGKYTLQITAQGCAGRIPDAAVTRTYDASVAQAGPRLTVTLSGADFIVTNGHGNGFVGTAVGGDRVVFSLNSGFVYYYYYYYGSGDFDIVERLTPTSVLMFSGTATANNTGSGLSGSLSGMVGISQRLTVPFFPSSTCFSPSHRFEMRRQS